MPIVPFFGSNERGRSVNVTSERRINVYTEKYPDPDKTMRAIYGRPGLTLLYAASTTIGISGPCRGMGDPVQLLDVTSTAIGTYIPAVFGNVIWALQTNAGGSGGGGGGTGPLVLFLNTSSGPVQIASNPTQIMFVDGTNGYILVQPTLTVLPGATSYPANATTVCTIASRFVVDDPTSIGRFRWSAIGDGLIWNPLDFATAESSSDPLMSVFEAAGELLLFGRDTLEFWAPVADTRIFARIGSAGVDWGCAAKYSIKKISGGVAWLGHPRAGGERQVLFCSGHTVVPISTPDVTYDINQQASIDGATACAFVIGGHAFYVLNLQTTSWVYDFTSNEWSEWQTAESRWTVNYVQAGLNTLVSADVTSTNVYKLDTSMFTDNAVPMAREVWTKHIFNDLERLSVDEVQLDMESGVGLTSGQGSDPQMMMQLSPDSGHTFGNERWTSIGMIGNYAWRSTWLKCGMARDIVFRFRMTDPVKFVIVNGKLRVSQ